MSAVSEIIVREYFELHGFLVRQQRKHLTPTRAEDEEIDFLVVNPAAPKAGGPVPFVLGPADVAAVARAVVVVKGWHTDTFSAGVLANAPEIFRFLEPSVMRLATQALGGGGPPVRMLVLPALPQNPEGRAQSMELLRAKGVDCVLPFHTVLAELIAHVEVNRNYHKSDLLQTLRILKNYGFLKGPQMELFKPKASSPRRLNADPPELAPGDEPAASPRGVM
jgi:hypothetical protein